MGVTRERRQGKAAGVTRRAAVVGAGPSGFYAAAFLLDNGFEVDLIEALPTPFGLVRAGVAPDHPKIKSLTRVHEKTAWIPGFRFFGGATLGVDVTRDELLELYHAVVYAVGSATDNKLGVSGEELTGSHAATEFVAWYTAIRISPTSGSTFRRRARSSSGTATLRSMWRGCLCSTPAGLRPPTRPITRSRRSPPRR